MLPQNMAWDDEMEALANQIWGTVDVPTTRATEPHPTSDYPAAVLRYGEPGKALYDAEVRVLMQHGDSATAARAIMADPEIWQSFVLARNLVPVA